MTCKRYLSPSTVCPWTTILGSWQDSQSQELCNTARG